LSTRLRALEAAWGGNEKIQRKKAILQRDREIAAGRLSRDVVERLLEKEKLVQGDKSPELALPSRFDGDLHALHDEYEYFAVAAELYFSDSDRFQRAYTKAEQAKLIELLDRNGIGDLQAVR